MTSRLKKHLSETYSFNKEGYNRVKRQDIST